MKKIILTVASLGMAGSMAVYAQNQETTPYEPNRDIVTESQRDLDRSMGERQHDSPVQSDYDKERHDKTTQSGTTDTQGQYGQDKTKTGQHGGMGKDLSAKTAEELEGKKVVTLTGEEVGEINDVGTSATRQARVATVDVGGFLGIGEKTIAIPLSELQSSVSDEDSVRTSMTRTSIEALPEFDESDFTADDEAADDSY